MQHLHDSLRLTLWKWHLSSRFSQGVLMVVILVARVEAVAVILYMSEGKADTRRAQDESTVKDSMPRLPGG